MRPFFTTIYVSFLLFTSLLSAQDWQTDFLVAQQLAAENNKAIVLVFQGSDWCAPCIKLDREIWSTDTFKNYAKQHYIMLQADFTRRKKNQLSEAQTKANAKLAEKYNSKGYFPLVVVLDKEGNVLGESSYNKMSPKDYIKQLNTFLN